MGYLTLGLDYLWWHYTGALSDLFRNYFNFTGFLANFFSLGQLFKTLLAPWRRLGEKYGSILDGGQFFTALVVNTLMRAVGLVIKTALIVFSLLAIFLSSLIFLAVLIFWLAAPVITISLFVFGLGLILS